MSTKKLPFLTVILFALVLQACKQSDPPAVPSADETGDLFFSGYYWNYKNSNETLVGPGPNKFSNSPNNIWLDADNNLHLKITKVNNSWYCSELISSKAFSYGTYIFTTASDLTLLNEKEIFGLFSWSNYSFQTQANSEVDIEFSRWNIATDTSLLTCSVQPVWFDNPAPYLERTKKPTMKVSKLKGICTHVFKWTPDIVTWETVEGENYPGGNVLATWSYDKTNISRSKLEGGKTSNPIVIPAPDDSTNVRFNLWLLNGQGPANGKETEVVIKSFRFIPL